MGYLLVAGVFAAIMAAVTYVWRREERSLWVPPGATEARAVACRALGIAEPRVFWVRGETFPNTAGVEVYGQWAPDGLTIAKADGAPYSHTALGWELAREARHQLEHVTDNREPVKGQPPPPELERYWRIAQDALVAWEQDGHPQGGRADE